MSMDAGLEGIDKEICPCITDYGTERLTSFLLVAY